jgi:uridylate kinase
METNKSFESVDLEQLENVVGGGRLARKIKNALKKTFKDPGGDAIGLAALGVGIAALAE